MSNTRSVFIPGPAPWGFRTAGNPLRIIRVRKNTNCKNGKSDKKIKDMHHNLVSIAMKSFKLE